MRTKEQITQYKKHWYLNNKDRILQKRQDYYLENKEALKNKSNIYYINNKEKIAVVRKNYQNSNKEALSQYLREYRAFHKEKASYQQKEWKNLNKEHYLKTQQEWSRKQRSENPCFKLNVNTRRRILHVLKNTRRLFSIAEMLGCSFEVFKGYLESKFQPGMTWENYGKWQIDHIIPCNSYNFNNPLDQLVCFHYSNTQPLWAKDNYAKGITPLAK